MILQLRKKALGAEIAQLDEMLRTRDDVDDPIGVFQLAQRVSELRHELEQLGVDVQRTGSVALSLLEIQGSDHSVFVPNLRGRPLEYFKISYRR